MEYIDILRNYSGRKIRIMEVCGTHTHEIFRLGIRSLLPENIELISGPGCPVCVTPPGYLDSAIELALKHNAVIATFGDLIRVPGSEMSLAQTRTQGAALKTVYSPLDAVEFASANPDKEVVFLAVGFETTTPSACLAVKHAAAAGLKNFSILTANKTMPEAYKALQGSADAFLYPGHVHAIIGTKLCEDLTQLGVSGCVAGFTAEDIIKAIALIIKGLETGKPFFCNAYERVVKSSGNLPAQKFLAGKLGAHAGQDLPAQSIDGESDLLRHSLFTVLFGKCGQFRCFAQQIHLGQCPQKLLVHMGFLQLLILRFYLIGGRK